MARTSSHSSMKPDISLHRRVFSGSGVLVCKRMSVRKYLWILLLLALACWISGCGGGGGSSNPLEPSDNDYILSALVDGHVVRWTEPIPVYLDTVNVPADWKQADVTFFQQAATQWANASQGKISFVYITSPVNPCVSVRWVKDHPMGEDPPTIGATRLTFAIIQNTQYIQGVTMELAVDGATGVPLSDNIMRLLSLHELGHAIGICGHSDDPNDLMYKSLASQSGLSARDIATINRLYDLPADIYQMPASKRGITPESTSSITMP